MSEDHASILAKTARGAGWVVAWRMMTRTLGLMSTLVLVRLLAPGDFGLVALAASFAASVEAFAWMGIEEGVIRHKAPTPALYNTAFTLSALRGAAIGLVVAAAAYPAARFFGESRLAPVMLALAVVALIESLTNIGTVEFRRDFSFQKEFRLWLLPRMLSIVLAIGLALAFRSYWALIAGIVANQALRVLFSYTMHPYRPRLALGAWRQLLGYSAWNSVLAWIGVLRSRVDTLMIGRVLNTTEVGLYSVGYEIAELPVTELIAPLARAAFSGFAAALRAELDSGQTWLRLVAAMGLLTLPAGVGMSAIAHPLVAVAFGPGWERAVPVVALLAVAFCLTVLGIIAQTVFLAQGHMRTLASISLGPVLLRTALLALLIPPFGLTGAAVAACIGIAAEQVFSAVFVMRSLRLSLLHDLVPQIYRCVLATVAMGAALFAAGLGWRPANGPPAILLAGGVGFGVTVYVLVLAGLWLAAGRPPGPEADVLTLGRQMLRRPRAA